MKLGNTVQFNSLKWVMEELRLLLTDVQRQFETYVSATSQDSEQLDDIIAVLHQVHGTLSIIEIHGAALLSEEMEALLKALRDDEVANKDNVHEVFMRAALKLPDYLDSLSAGNRDIPILLLPLLNDMRACRNASLLSENVLFFPNISASTGVYSKSALSLTVAEDAQQLARKLRHNYQLGLLGWFKTVDRESALEKMKTVLTRLQRASQSEEAGRLWWVAMSIVDGLQHDALESSVALKSLMGQVDRQIKILADGGEELLVSQLREELLKNLLYYVASSEAATELISQVKNEFELNRFLPRGSELEAVERTFIGPNQELLKAVSKGIREDVAQAKDNLDIYMHSDRADTGKLRDLLPLLAKIGDTLGMLGMGNTRARLLGQRSKLEQALNDKQAKLSEDILMSVAGALLSVDDDVESYVEHRNLPVGEAVSEEREPTLVLNENQKVISAVVNEALRDLSRVKDAFLSYLTQPFNIKPVQQALEIVKEIRGAMFVAPLDAIAPMLNELQTYLRQNIIEIEHMPETHEQNLFADVVTNIECYLEAVAENRMDSELYLSYGLEAVDRLKSVQSEAGSAPRTAGIEIEDMQLNLEELADELKYEVSEAEEEIELSGGVSLPEQAAEPTLSRSATMRQRVVALPEKDYESLQIIGEEADEEILDIFIEEALEELGNISELFPLWRQDSGNSEAITTIRRSFHTLKGSGRLVGASLMGEFAWCMENMFNRVIDGTIHASTEMYQVIEEAIGILPQLIEQIRGNKQPLENAFELMRRADKIAAKTVDLHQDEQTDAPFTGRVSIPDVFEETGFAKIPKSEAAERETAARTDTEVIELVDVAPEGTATQATQAIEIEASSLRSARAEPTATARENTRPASEASGLQFAQTKATVDPILLGIFTDESENHLQTVNEFISKARGKGTAKTTTDLLRALHTLNGSSKTAKFHIIAEVANLLEQYAKNLDQLVTPWSEDDLDLMAQCVTYIYSCIDYLKDHTSELTDEEQIVLQLKQRLEISQQQLRQLSGEEAVNLEEPTSVFEEFDPELVDIFLEEGEDLVDAAARTLQKWLDSGHQESYVAEMMRLLHTLKGGARMASLGAIGDLSHTLESFLIAISAGRVIVNAEIEHLMHAAVDRLAEMLEQVKQYQVPADADDLLAMMERARSGELTSIRFGSAPAASSPTPAVAAETLPVDEFVIATHSNVVPAEVEKSPALDSAVDDDPEAGFQGMSQQEHIRVRADKLDNLVNFAGEVNVYHGRLNQHMGDLGFNLGELGQTVQRLRNQLREMEIETEAQIASRYEREAENPEIEFDPLEMDRYSHMQQLTRSLSESASDLDNIREILQDLLQDSEAVIQQQSRVSTELQEELLQTRMVRFEGLTTRMRRIVRQTARQLNKKVELYIEGAATEIDRSVQDRMLAPLEHMLRNAVYHGVELPDERTAAGKAERGSVNISIDRDGSYVVMRISDDGRGIDPERVRRKALQQGLLKAGDNLSDQEVLRYVLQKGFSTADDVSQIAGRGVGMDVVDSEVKQLGGSLSISSQLGQGTTFMIRLPLTLSINQALLVQTGEEIYAIPLTSIEGVARVSAQDIEENVLGQKDHYEYAGQTYRMYYLGALLGTGAPTNLSKDLLYPLLLVRSGERHFALSIDAMVGRREVVVKPVGPQISSIAGFSGATILADGRVALILDIGGLVGGEIIEIQTASNQVELLAAKTEHELTVMVVDDSITIRKVTARILGRHRLRVMTAKDGLDAVEQLQEHVPDLFLMDIEMPRMDGFELASYVRSESRLQAIPIIMITSRTGQKHRDRAEQIGVDRYLGKPFQENELMDEVNVLLNRKAN